MADYKLADGGVVRTSDNAFVPDDMRNVDWQAYQEWLAASNTPDPADPAPTPPTSEEVYDLAMQTQRVLKAYAIAINKGTIVPGSNMALADLKAAVVAEM